MSLLMESEKEGVTVFWRLEDFSKTMSPFFAEFKWPATGSVWQLYLEPDEMAVRILYKDGEPVSLNVTYSLVTNENTFYNTARLSACRFTREIVKAVKLKTLHANEHERESFFPNDTLTLRIHLWEDSEEKATPVQYYIRSRNADQKCSFQWIINCNRDGSGSESFSKCETEVPGVFTDFVSSEMFRLKMILLFENFGDIVIENSVKSHVQFNLNYKLTVQCEGGGDPVLFAENEHVSFYTFNQSRRRQLSINLTEFKSKKELYFPKGYLVLNCDVTVLSPSYVMQNVNFGSKISFAWNSDGDNCHSVAIMSETPSEENMSLRDSLYKMYKDGQFCDVTLRAGDKTYGCHKTVLCARSPVFRALFANNMKEKETSVVDITDVEARTLDVFLTTLYTDNLGDVDWELAVKLYAVSDKYSILSVRKKCTTFLLSRLDKSNVCEMLVLADAHQDRGLSTTVQSFFNKHAGEIVHSEQWSGFMVDHIHLAADMMRLSFPK